MHSQQMELEALFRVCFYLYPYSRYASDEGYTILLISAFAAPKHI